MKNKRKPSTGQQGQVSVMMGIMILTFLFFFCFVVNVGMLVNAKINLQNAADMAAYAGAAVQARQLDKISFLNYEMRRQFKKFLFRYYVIGNVAQRGFPRVSAAANGHTPNRWVPNPNIAASYNVPVVCVIFNQNDNYCQIENLPKIQAPSPNVLDNISVTLFNQLTALDMIRVANCNKISTTNLMLLQAWLYNSDPELTVFNNPGTNLTPDMVNSIILMRDLARGLGLIPRNLLLYSRIRTMHDYLNAPAQNLTLDSANALRSSADPWAAERSVNAFFSAYYTLGNNTFDSADFTLEELVPPGAESMIKLKPVTTRFDTFAVDFETDNGAPTGTCRPYLIPQTPPKDIIVGVSKLADPLTYYAVRLHAKAQLMFSPFGNIDMVAYSAARPFGSRIGYPLEDNRWFWPGSKPPDNFLHAGVAFGLAGHVPNIPISPDEGIFAGVGPGNGYDSQEVLGTLLRNAFPAATPTGTNPPKITAEEVNVALEASMAPQPYESGYYNIINDLSPDIPGLTGGTDPLHFQKTFDSFNQAMLWAPIVAPGKGTPQAELQTELEDLIPTNPADPKGAIFKAAIIAQMSNYLTQLGTGTGEDSETLNTVRLHDPFRPQGGVFPNIAAPNVLHPLPDWLMNRSMASVLTSWNHPNDSVIRSRGNLIGRTGYSVKFVSFKSLQTNRSASNPNSEQSFNFINSPDADLDLTALQH